MSKFQWKEEYSVGVAEIDFEHKRLIEAIADLSDAINAHTVESQMQHVLNQLDFYVSHHFATEERYFERFNYAGAEEHIKYHRDFEAKVAEFRKKYENHEEEISAELIIFLEDWLSDHMLNVDRKYMQCFSEHGLK